MIRTSEALRFFGKTPPLCWRDRTVVDISASGNGEPKFPRTWNDETSRTADRQAAAAKLNLRRRFRYRPFCDRPIPNALCALAGSGPVRAGEALGLEIDKHISEDFRTLSIEQKAKRGEIQPYLKTKNGKRKIDLCSFIRLPERNGFNRMP